ncbi:MAG: hypothetical protein KGL39_33970 [Patescibacteria group bacterium]|nr:hypothetical protein [Patescibacteria group bacterium]
MALTAKQYWDSGFKIQNPNDPASIQDAINALRSPDSKVFEGFASTDSPSTTWAGQAQMFMDQYNQALKNGTADQKGFTQWAEKAGVSQGLENEYDRLQQATDTINGRDLSPAQKDANHARMKQILDSIPTIGQQLLATAASTAQGRGGWTGSDASRVMSRYSEGVAQAKQKINDAISNAKNTMAGVDNGKITDPSQVAALKAQAAGYMKSIGNLADPKIAALIGLDTKGQVYQDANGNWIPGTPPAAQTQQAGGPPAGATLISGPSGLQGLTESQIWRDPNSNKIYKLAPGTTASTGGTAAPQTSTAPASGSQGQGGTQGLQFYRVGGDIYDAATGRHIGPTEWNSTWSGRATEVSAPSTGAGTPVGGTGGTQGGQGTTSSSTATGTTSNSTEDKILALLQSWIDKMGGINQSVQVTPELAARFLTEAQNDPNIGPYYTQQIAGIKDQLVSDLSYAQQQYELKQQQEKTNFSQALLSSREQAAGAGTALSGARGLAEQQMQQGEQAQLKSEALAAAQSASNAVRGAEQQTGTSALSGLQLPNYSTPNVTLNARNPFQGGIASTIYTPGGGSAGSLLGSLGYSRNADVLAKQNQLENNYIQQKINNPNYVLPPSIQGSSVPSALAGLG